MVAATALAAWQHLDQGRWSEGARVNLKLWFEGNLAKGFALTGSLQAQDVPLKLPANLRLPERTEANISGRWQADAGWQLVLGQLQFHWQQASSPPVNISLGGKLGNPLARHGSLRHHRLAPAGQRPRPAPPGAGTAWRRKACSAIFACARPALKRVL